MPQIRIVMPLPSGKASMVVYHGSAETTRPTSNHAQSQDLANLTRSVPGLPLRSRVAMKFGTGCSIL